MSFLPHSFRFRPAIIPTLGALLAISATLYLGHWQQGRAEEKRVLQNEFEARKTLPPVEFPSSHMDGDFRFRTAVVRGEWMPSLQIFVDNKVDSGAAGYHVVTPMRIDGSDRVILVNRGWIARSASYPEPPSISVKPGMQSISGMLVAPSQKFLELGTETIAGNVWQNLTIERFVARTKRDAVPYLLLANDAMPPLIASSEQPNAGVEKHVEYMMTWYSLAATVGVLWIVLNLESTKTNGRRSSASQASKNAHS